MITRRAFVAGLALAPTAGIGTAAETDVGPTASEDRRPLALVYRGPASCPGCSESVAALLRTGPAPMRAVFCGPGEDTALSAASLSRAALYAQPGGGDVEPAWRHLHRHAHDIRTFVERGGSYLGFCLGGYLAGITPGFGLLPGDAARYIGSPGAAVTSTASTVVPVTWGGRPRHMFFQDGPRFVLRPGATVVATYPTGAVAAAVARHGAGRVGVVGPHPEADARWYADAGLTNPDGVLPDLGRDLVGRTLAV